MNCWFCNAYLPNSGKCETKLCHNYGVQYSFIKRKLNKFTPSEFPHTIFNYKTQFTVDLYKGNTPKFYIISYFPENKMLEVRQDKYLTPQEILNYQYSIQKPNNVVINVPYEKPILTPSNAFYKLPTLLLFS